jgi:hypothetical protein
MPTAAWLPMRHVIGRHFVVMGSCFHMVQGGCATRCVPFRCAGSGSQMCLVTSLRGSGCYHSSRSRQPSAWRRSDADVHVVLSMHFFCPKTGRVLRCITFWGSILSNFQQTCTPELLGFQIPLVQQLRQYC